MASSKPGKDPILKYSSNALFRASSDGIVRVMHLKRDDSLFELDAIAADFWQLIDGKKPLSSIKAILKEKHQPPTDLFEEDIQTFLKELIKLDLVTQKDNGQR